MAKKPHVVVVPYPAQGHLAPLMKLAYRIAHHGIKVTFVIAEFIHDKVMAALPEKIPITLVSVSAGVAADHGTIDRKGITNIIREMPVNLQSLIENINRQNSDEQVSCVVADGSAWWAIQVAKNLGIKTAAVVPVGAEILALVLHVPKLLEAGVLDVDGMALKDDLIYVTKETPWNTKELPWSIPGDAERPNFFFKHFVLKSTEAVKISDWVLVNSFYELEQSSFDLIPDALPIGPLLITNNNLAINLWPEDSTCLNWLDQQPQGSVIYAAFGSTGTCNQQQFHELAYAFELMNKPFLWVVRSNFTRGNAEFPDGFLERVANYGKIVQWAPQEKVLAHNSVAVFFSHCGWSSTMEGVSFGVPFLCWPYFVDQFHNSDCICDTWKVGLRVIPEENGIVTRHQIKSKIEKILSDEDIKSNSLKLKQLAAKSVGEGGSSFKNFMSFIEHIKE